MNKNNCEIEVKKTKSERKRFSTCEASQKVFLSGNLNYKFELTTIKFKLYDVGEPKINTWSSYKGRRANALALGADEGRGKLR